MRNALLLLFAGALALATLAAPASSPADQCQPGSPSGCEGESPSEFGLGKVGHPRTGVVTIHVTAPSGGAFFASGKQMKAARAKGREAGSFTLELRLTKRGLEKLSRAPGRQLRIAVEFAFTPTAGEPSTKRKKLIFRVVKRK